MSNEKFIQEHDVRRTLTRTSGDNVNTPSNKEQEDREYHAITAKVIAVYLGTSIIAFTGLVNVVGSGAFASYIAASVGGASEDMWMSQVSAITITLLGPVVAQAADYWGRKWIVVFTTLLGFVGCMVVARANSMGVAIAGQVLAALGYSSQALLGAIASEIMPRRFRPAAQGGQTLITALGSMFAVLFGFRMVEVSTDGWRIYWYVTAGLMLVSAVLFLLAYNPPPRPLQVSLSTSEKIQRLDWTAYVLLAAGIVPLNMGLAWYDDPYPWNKAHVSAPFAVGIAGLIAFAIHETFIKKKRSLPS